MSGWGAGGLVGVVLVLATTADARAGGAEVRVRVGAGGRNDVFDSARAEVRDVGPLLAGQVGVRFDDRFVVGASAHGSFGLPPTWDVPGSHRAIYSFGGGVFAGARQRWTTSLLGELLPGLEVGLGVRRVSVGIDAIPPEGSPEAVWLLSSSLTVHVDRSFATRRGGYGVWFAAHQDLTHGLTTYSLEASDDRALIFERYFVGGYGFTAGFEFSWGPRVAVRN